jgi:RNA recognition motif-containing protein
MDIFVAKLNHETTGDDLKETFKKFGEVISAKVIIDYQTGRSKGYGFVEMPNEEEANEAINQLNDTELNGNVIVVKKSEPKNKNSRSRYNK